MSRDVLSRARWSGNLGAGHHRLWIETVHCDQSRVARYRRTKHGALASDLGSDSIPPRGFLNFPFAGDLKTLDELPETLKASGVDGKC